MEDVIRFLRQIGDVVVRSGDGFCVNSRYLLTRQEIVQRANKKRNERGKPLFALVFPEAGSAPGEGATADGNRQAA